MTTQPRTQPPLIKPFTVSPKDFAWTAARKKLLANANSFAKALDAWQTKPQAFDTFARSLNLESWSQLRHVLRVLDKFEQTCLLLPEDQCKMTKETLASLYNDSCIADFLGLPDFTHVVSTDHMQLRQCMRHMLDMLAFDKRHVWVTPAQSHWLKLQEVVVTDVAGSQARTLVAGAWGITEDRLNSYMEGAVTRPSVQVFRQYTNLKAVSVASDDKGFWIRANSAIDVLTDTGVVLPATHSADAISIGLACQVVTGDTLLRVSNTAALSLQAAVTRPLHLSMLCRVGWMKKSTKPDAMQAMLTSLSPSLLRPSWQILV